MRILKDNDIRHVLLKELNERIITKQTKIINEMGIFHGRSRIDVAVMDNGFHGFEIKSESDNLNRLPRQIKDYNLVFERMHIVTQRKYLNEIREMVPKWWGIILVTQKNNKIQLKEIRKGRHNKQVNTKALSTLLWREEAIEILKEKGLHKGILSKPKKDIYQRLSNHFEYDELKVLISQKIIERDHWLLMNESSATNVVRILSGD